MTTKEQRMHLLLEGALIVFSVLFALFIDRIADNVRTNQQKKTSLRRIHEELTRNDSLMAELVILHQSVIQNLNAAIVNKSDTLRIQITRDGYLNYRLLAKGASLFPRYPSNTAWEAAKATGIISEFDYAIIEACAGAYSAQHAIVSVTLPKIVEELFDVDHSQVDRKLIRLKLEFEEILAQEKTLRHFLAEALQHTYR